MGPWLCPIRTVRFAESLRRRRKLFLPSLTREIKVLIFVSAAPSGDDEHQTGILEAHQRVQVRRANAENTKRPAESESEFATGHPQINGLSGHLPNSAHRRRRLGLHHVNLESVFPVLQ